MDKPWTQPKYSPEVRDRAVRLVFDQVREHPSQWAAIAAQIGGSAATLHAWVRQVERDRGMRPGLSSEDNERIKVDLPGSADRPFDLLCRHGTPG